MERLLRARIYEFLAALVASGGIVNVFVSQKKLLKYLGRKILLMSVLHVLLQSLILVANNLTPGIVVELQIK